MTLSLARNAIALSREGMLSRTLAYSTESRNSYLIFLAICVACVINGETLTGILAQATWLITAVIVLVVVQGADRLVTKWAPSGPRSNV
ncbi:hypothetical protein ACIRG4_11250 [Streptomyces sp. NPDC102395]|uniref:hypothetical protein n=1 Tax=Streptomyces sp. NPDC102395 TaxID=3366168 RepID=UPI0038116C6A